MEYRGKFLMVNIMLIGLLAAASLESQTARSSYALSKLPALARPIAFQAPNPAPGQVAKPAKLNINVIGGAGAVNDVKQRTPRDITVEIDDENDHPVAGAMVTFFAPNEGPGGSFVGDSHLLTVMTGSDGRAVAKDFRPNDLPGDYNIQVSVAFADQSANSTISQSNQVSAEPPATKRSAMSGKKIGLIVAAGAAVAVGAAFGLARGGSSTSSSSSGGTATVGLGGPPTVGAPH
ncbi:MAG: hypothetical protein ACR2IV_07155 [Bryobacteraceae bacterium]